MGKTNLTRIIAEPGKQEILITRDFDAPREFVFKAFTDPELLIQWLGPRKLTMIVEKFESKNGGSWRFIHKDREGHVYGFYGAHHEIAAPERIIRTFEFEGLPERGHVSLETANFEEMPEGRTKLVAQSVFQSVADRDGMIQSGMEEGVNESYERLDELLEKMMGEEQERRNHMDTKVKPKKEQEEQILITRDFNAPRSLIFKAWTDCGRLMSWWGPKGFTTPLCDIDLRPKGAFHYCMRSPEGKDYCGKGIYRDIVEPERIIYTDFFVDEKGNPVLPSHYGISPDWPQETQVTVTFAEHKGKTKLTLKHSVGSAPASERDMCEQGWSEMLDKLAENLAVT